MWVRVACWICADWDSCLGCLSRWRRYWRCVVFGRVVVFLLLIVEKIWRVDEVPPFVCLQHLRMGRQGKDSGGHVSIRVRRWGRFPLMICMAFFRSVGKTQQCQQLVCVWYGFHTRCGSDNDLVLVLCTNPHIRGLPNFLELQVYCV